MTNGRFVSMLKLFLSLCTILAFAGSMAGQFISVRGTHGSQFLSNGLYTADMSHAFGGEIIYSKPVDFIKWPINYNIGLDYRNTDGAHAGYIVTGITWVTRTPSGFMFAPNAESVSYVTSNWLQYASLNMYNGVLVGDSTNTYSMGWGLDYNFGYVFGKQFFVHWGMGVRYDTTPAFKSDEDVQSSYLDIMFKAGVLWKFKRKFYKA